MKRKIRGMTAGGKRKARRNDRLRRLEGDHVQTVCASVRAVGEAAGGMEEQTIWSCGVSRAAGEFEDVFNGLD